jgi:hypothetical protein
MLSVLARMGRDPWAEAAQWAKRPTSAIVDLVAASIERMPLRPQDLRDSRLTAIRLSRLLPGQVRGSQPTETTAKGAGKSVAHMPLLMILYCAVAVGLLVNLVLTTKPMGTQVLSAQSTEPPAGHSGSQ